MAGEWIPWVKGLSRRREVLQISATLRLSRREVASCCMEIWEWCDDEGEFDDDRNCHVNVTPMSQDCHTEVVSLSVIDDIVGVQGFEQAMRAVGWIISNGSTSIVFPELGQWIGSSAKERLSARRRKQLERIRSIDESPMSRKRHKGVTDTSRQKRDKNVTRSCSCSSFSEIGLSIPSCLDTEAFRTAWDTWEQVRREVKKPLTPTAAKLRLADCLKLGHEAAVAGLMNSATHQWLDIIVPEEFKPKSAPPSRVATKEDAKNWSAYE